MERTPATARGLKQAGAAFPCSTSAECVHRAAGIFGDPQKSAGACQSPTRVGLTVTNTRQQVGKLENVESANNED